MLDAGVTVASSAVRAVVDPVSTIGSRSVSGPRPGLTDPLQGPSFAHRPRSAATIRAAPVPISIPPIVSVSQCTLSTVRDNAIAHVQAIPARPTQRRGNATYRITATVAALAVWPEGNDP